MRSGVFRIGFALLWVAGCGGAVAERPLWEREGLRGAVRPEFGPPQPGDTAAEFELPLLDDRAFHLSELRGNWVLLRFTASWCPFCDTEVGYLGQFAHAYAGRGVKVVVIDVQEARDHWNQYAREHVDPVVIALWDGDGAVARTYAPQNAMPSLEDRAQVVFDSTVVIDPAGTIRLFVMPDSAHYDPTMAGIRRELDRLLAEADSQ